MGRGGGSSVLLVARVGVSSGVWDTTFMAWPAIRFPALRSCPGLRLPAAYPLPEAVLRRGWTAEGESGSTEAEGPVPARGLVALYAALAMRLPTSEVGCLGLGAAAAAAQRREAAACRGAGHHHGPCSAAGVPRRLYPAPGPAPYVGVRTPPPALAGRPRGRPSLLAPLLVYPRPAVRGTWWPP